MNTIEDIIRELNLKCTALNTNSVTIEQTDGNNEFKCNSHVSDFNKGKIEGLIEAKKLLEEVKQLDEPQKPKTEVFNHDEKFVIEWLDHTTGYHYSLYNAINDAGSEVRSWMKIGFNSNRFARALMSMDYEVEKEPLYYVYFPEIIASPDLMDPDIEGAYLMKNGDEVELADNNDFDDMKFTEQEIKAIDERYWAFAVPVEEVEEG